MPTDENNTVESLTDCMSEVVAWWPNPFRLTLITASEPFS